MLCDCRATLALNAEKLVLPVVPSVLARVSEPESAVPAFAQRAKSARLDHALIACCGDPSSLEKVFKGADNDCASTRLHFLNLRASCFDPHPDTDKAHAKATRLLRAATACAEAGTEHVYQPLAAGERIVVAGEPSQARKIADRLLAIGRPLFILPRSEDDISGEKWVGKIIGVKGRLGDFCVTVEQTEGTQTAIREIKADQVLLLTEDAGSAVKARTGCHIMARPSDADLESLLERVGDLRGEFLKTVQVAYHAELCAGGNADREACGACVVACPYEAISRDPENHLRMKVDQMACEGCGACASACPTSALAFTDPSSREIYTRMGALLTPNPSGDDDRSAILFHCSEHGRRLLDEAGRRPLHYAANLLPIEVPCLRFVSEANILAAFRMGAAGVAVLGCDTCRHGKRELLHQQLDLSMLTLDAFGLGAGRIEFFVAGDGKQEEAIEQLTRFAERVTPSGIRWDGKPLSLSANREVVADALSTFIRHTGREPAPRPLGERNSYAAAAVNAAGCTLCRSCVNVCPTHAFKVDEQDHSLRFQQISCVACGLCEAICPEHVITLRREMRFDRQALEYRTVVEDSMIACLRCGKPYINKRALETVEARVFALPALIEAFSGSRRNFLRMCPDCRAVAAMLEVEKGWKP